MFVTSQLHSLFSILQKLEKVHKRFFIALVLYDLYNEVPVWEVSEKFRIDRGLVQSMLQSAISFASCVYYFSLVSHSPNPLSPIAISPDDVIILGRV